MSTGRAELVLRRQHDARARLVQAERGEQVAAHEAGVGARVQHEEIEVGRRAVVGGGGHM
jgi:hypothetical protein